ncbi:hypothetical protein SELMODRAFT_129057 [Selaginella moellendorffii]|uniref:Protein kinase domain-containing protein n=1 Tax=Selaginella moellendorffii TaxID=88036 RepID=D8T041_SELML|nr:hypothetical protein SELMODRAFT_129057 [Selaginella moellendorffii]
MHGLVHDVKPDNIYIDEGVYKIGDFGLWRGWRLEISPLSSHPPALLPSLINSLMHPQIELFERKKTSWSQ